MQGTFHWLRVQAFCYATEDEKLVGEAMAALVGDEGFEREETEGEQGNRIVLMEAELTKQKQFDALFSCLAPIVPRLIDDIDARIDEDCTFYTRLDKQSAVKCVIRTAHGGDVISVTGKVVSHPARKEIATANLLRYLEGFRAQPLPDTSA